MQPSGGRQRSITLKRTPAIVDSDRDRTRIGDGILESSRIASTLGAWAFVSFRAISGRVELREPQGYFTNMRHGNILSAETEKPSTEDGELKIGDLCVIAQAPKTKRSLAKIMREMQEDLRMQIKAQRQPPVQ